MNAIDKLKLAITNFKESQNVTSLVALIGTIVTDNGINFIYAAIAVYVQYHNSKTAMRKAAAEVDTISIANERTRIDNALYKEERDLEHERVRLDIRERQLKLAAHEQQS